MSAINQQLLTTLEENHLLSELYRGIFGLEKEHVRVNAKGEVALTAHPSSLGDKLNHPYITTDFSESQVEIITPPLEGVEATYNMLYTLHNIVSLNIGSEYLWPQSTPPILPKEQDIPIAQFGEGSDAKSLEAYREHLGNRYGRKRQMISGIHINFSFPDSFLQVLHNLLAPKQVFKEFRDQVYLKIMRQTTMHSWLLIKLLGCSPVFHNTYTDLCKNCNKGISIRNGSCGYGNHRDLYTPLNSLSDYTEAIDEYIASGELHSAKELYSLIRPKSGTGSYEQLKERGIEYVELRLVDLNPLFPIGISKTDLYFLHSFFLLMFLLDDSDFTREQYQEAMNNNRAIADTGRLVTERMQEAIQIKGTSVDTQSEGLHLLDLLARIANLSRDAHYATAVSQATDRLRNPEKLYWYQMYRKLEEMDFIEFHMQKAYQYRALSESQQFFVKGFEDMELSTQILMLDALRRGVEVEILDRFSNFIRLKKGAHIEYVKEASKTSKDSYSTVLMMEHKAITKRVLEEAGLRTPMGRVYTSKEQALEDYRRYQGIPVVIKPNSTNFGIGITTFSEPCDRRSYEEALLVAFEHDKSVLVEEFIPGNEYRIFVIDGEMVAAMHRVPANVTGDGKSSIRALVQDKNRDPLRGEQYRKPLQRIVLGKEQELYLAQFGMDFDSIPMEGELVFLSKKSNISTGGDSIDMTDEISETFKTIAIRAAKAMGAAITGVDLITQDISTESSDTYAIIELNFNPAIHIHCYPYKGKNRHLGDKILDLLGF